LLANNCWWWWRESNPHTRKDSAKRFVFEIAFTEDAGDTTTRILHHKTIFTISLTSNNMTSIEQLVVIFQMHEESAMRSTKDRIAFTAFNYYYITRF